MNKICFVTSTRAEYGSLKWLMKKIELSEKFQLQLIVTGAHLMKEQGHTLDEILNDGFVVNKTIDAKIITTSKKSIAESMGRLSIGVANALEELKPDYIVLLGDRYELLAIGSTAFIMGIPIIHLCGGDVTEGAIDDGVRNAITMLSTYHFPSTEASKKNILRMTNNSKNIWAVGVPELDAVNNEKLMTRTELAENIGLDLNKKWGLLTYHAETKQNLYHNLETTKNLLHAIRELDGYQIVATYSNADYGGEEINKLLHEEEINYPYLIKVVPSLGHRRYLSFMKQVEFVIGNSSSGITEAPMLHIPSVNIGDRQKGRYQCSNVIQCGYEYFDIKDAVIKAIGLKSFSDDLGYWGDGHASDKIVNILSEVL